MKSKALNFNDLLFLRKRVLKKPCLCVYRDNDTGSGSEEAGDREGDDQVHRPSSMTSQASTAQSSSLARSCHQWCSRKFGIGERSKVLFPCPPSLSFFYLPFFSLPLPFFTLSSPPFIYPPLWFHLLALPCSPFSPHFP